MISAIKRYREYVVDKILEIRNNFSRYDSQEKAYLIAQLLWIFSAIISLTFIPLIVKLITENTALIGVVRTVYVWTTGCMSIFAGNIVKLVSMRQVLIWTAILRALIFVIIAILLFFQSLTFTLLLIIIFFNALIIAYSRVLDIESGGLNQIYSSEKKKESASYLYNLLRYASWIFIPLALGFLVDILEIHVGQGVGLGCVFLLFSTLMFIGAYLYYKYLIETKVSSSKLSQNRLNKIYSLLIDTPKDLWNTAKIIWNNSTILLRFTLYNFEKFINDSFLLIILPIFALDILNSGVMGNSLLLAAINLGGILAIGLLLVNARRLQKKYGFYPFVFWLGIAGSLAFIPTITFWTTHSLWIIAPAVVLMKLLYEPFEARMNLMLQSAIASDEKAKAVETHIYSLLRVFSAVFAGLGGLFFTWLFLYSVPGTALHAALGENASMKVVTLIMVGFSISILLGLVWLKRQVYHTYYIPKETTKKLFEDLTYHLTLLDLPPYHVEIIHSQTSSDRSTLVLLAPPTLDKLAIVQEGGRQAPGDVHLVFDPSWILQELQPDNTYCLYLKKGLYFDREGDPILVEYKQKRKIHYFANFCTPGALTPINGTPFESKLSTPMSGSSKHEHLIKETLLTRLWLANQGIPSIVTLALLLPLHVIRDKMEAYANLQLPVTIQPFPSSNSAQKEELTAHLQKFLTFCKATHLVIKPSGALFTPPYGVKIFSRDQVEDIIDYILQLSTDSLMTPEGAILIEERLQPPILYIRMDDNDKSGRYCIKNHYCPLHILPPEKIPTSAEVDKKDWVLHLLVARTPWNKGVTATIMARMDTWGKPLTKEAAVVPIEVILTALRSQYGLLMTQEEGWQFEKQLEELGSKALLTIWQEDKNYLRNAEDPLDSETDYLGLDVMIEVIDHRLVLKIIAINNHNVGKQYLADKIYPLQTGEHSRAWIATMLSRARRYILKGKRLVLVGAGDPSQQFYLDQAKELELEMILIDKQDSWAKNDVSEYIPIPDEEREKALEIAFQKLQRSIYSYGLLDGITTFWEDNVVFTAELARDLQLPYHSVESARTMHNKAKTQKILKNASLPVSLFFKIQNQHVLDNILHQINRIYHTTRFSPFPMVLKPAFGTTPFFKVFNAEEAREKYVQISQDTSIQSMDFILEEYIQGDEWEVDLVMQGGKVKYSSFTDQEVTKEFSFHSLSSYRLTVETQQTCIKLASNAVEAIGLTQGVIHVKGKYDPTKGARILEVNGQPGSAYLVSWQMQVWGVDLVEMLYATALQIPISSIYKSEVPLADSENA